MADRRRNALVLLLVALLLAVSAVIIATKPTRLGLDLKGGVSFIYKGIPTAHAKVNSESLNRAINIMRKRVDQLGVAQPEIQLYGGSEINVSLPDVTNVKRAEDQVGKTAQLLFYDWEPNVIGPSGNPEPTNRAVTCGREPAAVRCGLPEYKAIQLAAKRKPYLYPNATTLHHGCTPAQVEGCIYGSWYLVDSKHEKVLCGGGKPICGPADTQAELYADGYKPPAGVKAKAVHVNPGTVLVQAHPEEYKNKVVKAEPNSFYVLNDNPVLEGGSINNPQQGYQSEGSGSGLPDVTFGFDEHGKAVFERVTKEIAHRGENAQLPGVSKEEALQHFAIVLDEQVITAPSIDYTAYPNGIDASNGSEITGGFTLTSAQNLADELQSGALPIKLEQISHSQVSATLGKTALNQGLLAMAVGLLVVCIFLLTFYRVLGIIAIGGLAIYSIYYFALIKAIPIVLTLPGIAGLILTIGIAADANIVIFERIKEEIRAGRSIPAGIAAGYKRGFAAIVDANVVTFMTAFILFALATAEVQGFAFTLGIGTLLSLFTAVLATQAALGAMGRSRVIGHPALLGAARAKRALRFDFMGASRWFFSLSGTILLIGALAIGGKGINFGIDFTSGTRIQTGFTQPISQEQIRTVLREHNLSNAQIQKLTGDKNVGGSGYQISVKRLKPAQVAAVEESLGKISPLRDVSDNSIGPTFGATVAKSAVIAIIASLIVISVYIALRFEWKYAVPVLIALMHDLLITAGVYALTGREVSSATVAALLTILGYSLYDTIIVFDRVRENVPRMPRAAFSQIVNRSMSEVLTRSLATSFCTLLPVLALLLFGGETLKNFAFALMVGIASGAYSSIFIASPVLTHWKEREGSYRNRRARLVRDFGAVPPYATALDGSPIDVEPAKQRRRQRKGGLLVAAEEPGEQVSQEEFEEMVRDLDIEREDGTPTGPRGGRGAAGGVRGNGRRGRGGRTSNLTGPSAGTGTGTMPARTRTPKAPSGPPPTPAPEEGRAGTPSPPQDPAADLTPEDLVLKGQPKRQKRPRNKRHGRSR
ncbi:MAG TPA: protein translocase subunit SecD [Solirubrobacteraceae bacterium]|jgi:SecD/SecF fusion protein|nr:protein translocase subunit SecD [Solirubrobacteraceae bacterium]